MRSLVALLAPCLVACIPEARAIRTGKALPTAVGAAQNSCETSGMIELAPTRAFAHDESYAGGWGGYSYYTRTDESQQGLGIYRRDGTGPLKLVELLPGLGEPELANLHFQKLDPYERRDAKTKVAQKIAILGAIGVLVGTGLATHGVLNDDDHMVLTGAVVMGGASLVAGAAAIAALVMRPTPLEHTYHDLRTHVLVAGEDDTDAAVRGVDRFNESVRARCR